jgi:hypothetical protein
LWRGADWIFEQNVAAVMVVPLAFRLVLLVLLSLSCYAAESGWDIRVGMARRKSQYIIQIQELSRLVQRERCGVMFVVHVDMLPKAHNLHASSLVVSRFAHVLTLL